MNGGLPKEVLSPVAIDVLVEQPPVIERSIDLGDGWQRNWREVRCSHCEYHTGNGTGAPILDRHVCDRGEGLVLVVWGREVLTMQGL